MQGITLSKRFQEVSTHANKLVGKDENTICTINIFKTKSHEA